MNDAWTLAVTHYEDVRVCVHAIGTFPYVCSTEGAKRFDLCTWINKGAMASEGIAVDGY